MSTELDPDAVIAEVAKRHRVILDRNDPILAVATILMMTLRQTRAASLSRQADTPMWDDAAGELETLAAAIRMAAEDASKARLWAFIAAGLSGGIALGIVLVLTAPVWGTVFS
ncbi:MAG: hypothetical protein ACM31D_12865 [Bacteroidota bacterium]